MIIFLRSLYWRIDLFQYKAHLQVEIFQASHLVEAVEGDVPDVIVAQVQGVDPAQAPESLVRKSPEVEGVGELEVADGVTDLPEGVVRYVLDSVVGLRKEIDLIQIHVMENYVMDTNLKFKYSKTH